MKKLFTLILFLVLGSQAALMAQTCTPTYVPKPSQDCHKAIQLGCGLRYTYPTGIICGAGNIEDEIPTGSCLTANEKNTTWYVFKVRTSGRLQFAILPLDMTPPNDSGDTDYDWALFRLPLGDTNTLQTCALLTDNLNWQVSCNYSADDGATGILDTNETEDLDVQGAGGSKWNRPLYVNAGEVYVLAVDNFTGGTQIGYNIRFRAIEDMRNNADSTLGIADIRPETVDPRLDSVLQVPTCVRDGITFNFTKEFFCGQINDGAFQVINLVNPNLQFDIDTVYGIDCQQGGTKKWFVGFSPILIDSNYALIIRDTLTDICGKVLINDTLRFRVNPFVRLESFFDNQPQDSICSGQTIKVLAVPDEGLEARIGDFTYNWILLDSASGTETPLVVSDSVTIDSNIIQITRHVPLRTTIFLIVDARGVRTACSDRDTIALYVNPLPVAPVQTPVLSCFGEPADIIVGNPADSAYYTYKWTSTLARPTTRVPQYATFKVMSDTTTSFSLGRDSVQHRFQHDVFKVIVAYKPQYGGCALPQQTLNFYAGKYMKPMFDVDSLIRPGKKGLYVLDTNNFYNRSTFQTRNSSQFVGETWDFGDSSIIRQPGISEVVKHRFEAPGQYRVALTLVDSILPGLYCTQTFTRLLEFVPSYWESGRRGEIGFVPNIVTPNGDNRNDYLEFVGVPVDGYSLEVYNRWGKKVYSQSPYNNSWVPKDIDRGVYFYRLKKVRSELPSKDEVTGWFEVIY